MATKKNFWPMMLGLFFMFVFGYICPTWATVTPVGIKILGALIGWLVLSIAGFGLLIPSLLAVVACVLSGYYTATEAIVGGFGSNSSFMVIFIFVLVWIFSDSKTGEFVVRWFLSRKFLNGKPYLITAVFLIVMEAIGAVISSLGAIVLAIVIVENVAKVANMKVSDPWPRFLLISVVAFSGITEMLLPFKGSAQMFISLYNGVLSNVGMSINEFHYLITGLVMAVFNIILLMLAARFVFHFDVPELRNLDVSEFQTGEFKKMKKSQIVILVVVVLAFFYPFIIMAFPTAMYQFLNSFGQVMFMAVCISFLGLLRIDGEAVTDIRAAFSKGINWDAVCACGAVSLLGGALGSEAAGITAWLLSFVGGAFDNLTVVPLMILLGLITCIPTQFFSNGATCTIISSLTAPMCALFAAKGINVSCVAAIVIIGSMSACLIPAGSSQSAVMINSSVYKDEPAATFKYGPVALACVMVSYIVSAIICSGIL